MNNMQSGTNAGTTVGGGGGGAGDRDRGGTISVGEEKQLQSSNPAVAVCAGSNLNSSRTSDHVKRRKAKSRSATVPINSNYPKEHFDAWLENCLKDAPTQQLLSSSSEFLDYNPSSFNSTRKSQNLQQQSQSSSQPNYHPQSQYFVNKSKSSSFQPPPFSQGFQKTVPNFMRNPYGNSQNLLHNDGSVEFASLPPIVNMLASENEHNSTAGIDGSSNPTNGRGFRFSDPCLINPSDNDSKISGQNTPDRRNFNNGDMDGNNKFFGALMEQINLLHETNSKICRNLHETKVDIEALKHAPNWGLRHRRDSLSGLSTHSQPMGFAFGTHSPAPTYHSGMYTPGMMTDVVREVKEAARVREDALLNRVKSMVEERSWSMSEGSLRMMRDIEELKAQVQHLRADRKESNKRIAQLEAENRYMRQIVGTLVNNRTEVIHENEIFRSTPLRKNFVPNDMPTQNRQRQNSLNLNYGTINQEDSLNTLHITERLEPSKNGSDTKSPFPDGHGPPPINGALFQASDNERSTDDDHLQLSNDSALELQRDLREALASRKQAESRIIALENIVRKLQLNISSGDERNNGIGNSSGDGNYFNSSQSPAAGDINVSQHQQQQQLHPQQLPQLHHTQGHSSKFSLAGPITDL